MDQLLPNVAKWDPQQPMGADRPLKHWKKVGISRIFRRSLFTLPQDRYDSFFI